MNDSAANFRSQAFSRAGKRGVWHRQAMHDLKTFATSIDIPGVPVSPDDEACERFHTVEARFGKHHLLWRARWTDVVFGGSVLVATARQNDLNQECGVVRHTMTRLRRRK